MSSKVNIEKGESSGLQTNLWWCYGKYVVQTAFRLSKNIGKNLTLAICSDEQDKLKSKDLLWQNSNVKKQMEIDHFLNFDQISLAPFHLICGLPWKHW